MAGFANQLDGECLTTPPSNNRTRFGNPEMREAGSCARAWTAGPSVQPKESPLLPDLSVTNDPWLACIWQERLAGRLSVRELRVLVALYAFRATADAARWPTQAQLARQTGYNL